MQPPAATAQGLAFDARSLDALRRDAARDPQAAVRQAAGQFEALFMQQLLKSMRDALPKSGLMSGPGHDTYVAMLDQQMAQSLAGRPGGLAEMIAKQLSRHLGGAAASSTTNSATSTSLSGAAMNAAGAAMDTARAAMNALGTSISGVRGTKSATPAVTNVTAFAGFRPTSGATVGATPGTGAADNAQAAEQLKRSLTRRLDGKQAEFVDRMWPHALAAQQATGVPAAFVVGQAALESGWGRQEIRLPDGSSAHNLFGVKAGSGWRGQTVDVTTTEYVDGRPVRTVEKFRAYGSYSEAFRDWATLMSTRSRYADLLRNGQSVQGFAQGMQRAGYATDPRYGEKLEKIINQTLAIKRLGV